MKIKGNDLDVLRKGLFDTLKAHNLHPFMVQNEGHAWEVFHKAWNEKRIDGNDLYKRYNDQNFATAFKHIFRKG